MALIQHLGRTLIFAAALSLPAMASAEQATEACDGDKMEEKHPTADKSTADQNDDKRDADGSDRKADDKSEQRSNAKRSGKTS
jgi:hypothetical protein